LRRIDLRRSVLVDKGDIDRLIAGMLQPKCTSCGHEDWRVFSNDIDRNPTRLVIGAAWPDGRPVEDYGFAVFAFACTHCGNVRLISADPRDSDDEPEPP
jgi:hypothetical protein